jgi:hypothetical protein
MIDSLNLNKIDLLFIQQVRTINAKIIKYGIWVPPKNKGNYILTRDSIVVGNMFKKLIYMFDYECVRSLTSKDKRTPYRTEFYYRVKKIGITP